MSYKQRLELDWIGKDEELSLEPRILIQDHKLSVGKNDSDNILIHGDNLLALKALEENYAGKIKCVIIDPPYNTGAAFSHYDDGIEHSLWLSLMQSRLKVIRKLMANDGSLWITIDDNEAHYLKVLCDELFGRMNFLADVIWEKADSPRSDAKYFSTRHDHVLVYAKDINSVKLNRIQQTETPSHYNKIDEHGRIYYLKPLRAMGADGHRHKRPSMYFPLITPDGSELYPKNPDGSDSRWQWGSKKIQDERERVEFVKTKDGWSAYFRIYFEDTKGKPPETIWNHAEVGTNRTSKKEIKDLFGSDVFDTPKPEKLIAKILQLSTEKGDLVLDSFAGSGTTGAVAHKMGRKWIMVELGDHCHTHIVPRMEKVIDGSDQGGISRDVGWSGGGGFKFLNLAPSLLQKDGLGNWVINSHYDALQLAEAVCKHERFKFFPHESIYWKQGYSSEKDFIFVTTQFLTSEHLDRIQEQMQKDETLLICAKAFRVKKEKYKNITLKKIPQMLLGRCEFGRDDYSLNIREEVQEELGMDVDA